jgi:hypothetical protein
VSARRIDIDPRDFAERLKRFEDARRELHELLKSWDDFLPLKRAAGGEQESDAASEPRPS